MSHALVELPWLIVAVILQQIDELLSAGRDSSAIRFQRLPLSLCVTGRRHQQHLADLAQLEVLLDVLCQIHHVPLIRVPLFFRNVNRQVKLLLGDLSMGQQIVQGEILLVVVQGKLRARTSGESIRITL